MLQIEFAEINDDILVKKKESKKLLKRMRKLTRKAHNIGRFAGDEDDVYWSNKFFDLMHEYDELLMEVLEREELKTWFFQSNKNNIQVILGNRLYKVTHNSFGCDELSAINHLKEK